MMTLLATIDQQIEEARALASHPELSDEEREFAAVQLDYRCRVVKRSRRRSVGWLNSALLETILIQPTAADSE